MVAVPLTVRSLINRLFSITVTSSNMLNWQAVALSSMPVLPNSLMMPPVMFSPVRRSPAVSTADAGTLSLGNTNLLACMVAIKAD